MPAGTEVARLLRELGHDAHFVETDVSDEAALDNLTTTAAEVGNGTIDCLVNVAGVDIIRQASGPRLIQHLVCLLRVVLMALLTRSFGWHRTRQLQSQARR